MKKPVLLIMAWGLWSRYGGLKQIDPIGPNGEILLEFALIDAIAIGIERVVIVICESTKWEFESMIVEKYKDRLKIDLVVQTVENIPGEKTDLSARLKPWGTGHAVWCAREIIDWPFIVMNADDFYGRDTLQQAYDFLMTTNDHCIITCPLTKMLSDYGTVSRGICKVADGKLLKIVEHTKVGWSETPFLKGERNKEENKGDLLWLNPLPSTSSGTSFSKGGYRRLIHTREDGGEIELDPEVPANMNFFGFQKSFLTILDEELHKFMAEYRHDPKREFYLLTAVDEMIDENKWTVYAIGSVSDWFGMTNPEDREAAKTTINRLIGEGQYSL